ncbi:MAG TPA: FmdB family zinc ribbon protein [Candidatus Hypogeohydataceae bacterium YC38]
MPIYEFQCAGCTVKFEEYFSSPSQKKTLRCPECGSGKVEKVFSVFGMATGSSEGDSGSSSACGSCSATSCATCR